jgi:hypothetical protein
MNDLIVNIFIVACLIAPFTPVLLLAAAFIYIRHVKRTMRL